jgi:hypothetical protein
MTEWNPQTFDAQAQEYEDLGPNAGLVSDGVDAKCLKRGQNDEDSRPAVVQRERQVNPELIVD